MFPCISCILLCSQKWLDVTLGTEPMLFLFFSTFAFIHLRVVLCFCLLLSSGLAAMAHPLLLTYYFLTWHFISLISHFLPLGWMFKCRFSHPHSHLLTLPCLLHLVSTAQMSVVGPGDFLPLGPLRLRLCSAACGAIWPQDCFPEGHFQGGLANSDKTYLLWASETNSGILNSVQCVVFVVKEVLSCFGKLEGRDKTDGRLATTKKCGDLESIMLR